MKFINKLATLIAVFLGLAAATVSANTFNFSYSFSDGTLVSGTLEGAQNGNLVTGITVDSLYFGGVLVPGPYYQTGNHHIGSFLTDQVGEAVVSFDVSLNNFWFLTDFWFHGNPDNTWGSYGTYFAILNNPDAHAAIALWQITEWSLILPPQDRPPLPASWSLTEVTSVPDGGMTGTMLGIAILYLCVYARRLRQ